MNFVRFEYYGTHTIILGWNMRRYKRRWWWYAINIQSDIAIVSGWSDIKSTRKAMIEDIKASIDKYYMSKS